MINVNELSPGVTFQENENIYLTLSASHSKSGRGQAHVKVKVKNLRTGATTIINFTGGDKVKKAIIDKVDMQFLYEDSKVYYFMNNEDYEQIEIREELLEWEKNFLKEGSQVMVQKYNAEILGIFLPDKVELKVSKAEPAVKGDTTSGALKKAELETGLEIMVPLFINENENIIVTTSDGKYSKRAS